MQNQECSNWLLVRGLARESAHWGEFIPKLQTAFPKANIHTLDLPGTGKYFQEKSPCSLRGIVDWTRARAEEQGLLKTPAVIMGLSLGGMVAWDWLQRYPDDIEQAVLLNTSFGGVSPFYHRLRWQVLGQFMTFACAHDLRTRELAFLKLLNNNRLLDEHLADDWVEIQLVRPVRGKNLMRQILAAMLYDPGPQPPAKPVLLLNSSADLLVEPSCSEDIQKRWGLILKTHEWAGHDMTADDGEWVISQIMDFCCR